MAIILKSLCEPLIESRHAPSPQGMRRAYDNNIFILERR